MDLADATSQQTSLSGIRSGRVWQVTWSQDRVGRPNFDGVKTALGINGMYLLDSGDAVTNVSFFYDVDKPIVMTWWRVISSELKLGTMIEKMST